MRDDGRVRGRPKSQAEIEKELDDLTDHLEAMTNGGISPWTGDTFDSLDALNATFAETKTAWKVAEAVESLRLKDDAVKAGGKPESDATRAQRAIVACQTQLGAYHYAEAAKDARREAASNIRSIIDAKRTQAANVRVQT